MSVGTGSSLYYSPVYNQCGHPLWSSVTMKLELELSEIDGGDGGVGTSSNEEL